ncbi:MAG TPA: alpha/beta hydrolase [Acidimicrobiales bacterium]|nr:alpha/beta hydrolase [Acidimicrobiales bacterium]
MGVIDGPDISARGFRFRCATANPADGIGPGAGRLVLFLHGFPQTSRSWHHQLEAVAQAGMRAVAFDQRGYSPGARPAGVGEYALAELVADVLAVADAEGAERFDLVGHDWGAIVAWAVAGRHPDRLRSLTAVSVPHPAAFAGALLGGDADQASRSSYMEVFRREGHVAEKALLGEDGAGDGLRAMFAASGLPPDRPEVEVFVAAMREPGAMTAALNWYRAMSAEDFADIGTVAVPTLYVWSTDDVAIGRSAAEATGRWVSGPYRFETLPGVSHWIPEMAPVELGRLLIEHLQSVS